MVTTDVLSAIRQLADKHRRVLLVNDADYGRVTGALAGCLDGLIEVRASDTVPAGTALAVNPSAFAAASDSNDEDDGSGTFPGGREKTSKIDPKRNER